MKPSGSLNDPIPLRLSKDPLFPILLRQLSKIVPVSFKHAAVTPLLNKHDSDTSIFSNFRTTSKLPFEIFL